MFFFFSSDGSSSRNGDPVTDSRSDSANEAVGARILTQKEFAKQNNADIDNYALTYDIDSLEYYFSIVALGRYLTYPETLKTVYEKHTQQANNGATESMYWVDVALRECEFAERMQTENNKGNLDKVKFLLNSDQAIARLERCSGLMDLVLTNEATFTDQSASWMANAARGGYRTAQVELAFSGKNPDSWGDTENEVIERVSSVLADAVRTEGYAAYYKAIHWINALGQDHREAARLNEGVCSISSLSIAWQISACSKHPG